MTSAESSHSHAPIVLVSGGQTGVDRGALDAALDAAVPCGGWCPEGRLAEDGTIPLRYPVQALRGAKYRERTKQNVIDSDGTLVISFGEPEGGTAQTVEFCRELGKPHLVIDALQLDAASALPGVLQFLAEHSIRRLNVAGPRASREPRAHGYAYELLRLLLDRLRPGDAAANPR